jgi:hypothetical protein
MVPVEETESSEKIISKTITPWPISLNKRNIYTQQNGLAYCAYLLPVTTPLQIT